jgi:hypothetical protein
MVSVQSMLSDPVLPCARPEKEVMRHSSIFFLGTWNRKGKACYSLLDPAF